jgi:predicted ester cyclase
VSEAANEAVIERFYHELWNRWNMTVADEIISDGVRFRGSLGSTLEGRENFKGYVETVRAAFPDWHNRIDEMISCGNRVVTRMTWSGTHRGMLQGVHADPPSLYLWAFGVLTGRRPTRLRAHRCQGIAGGEGDIRAGRGAGAGAGGVGRVVG